MASTKVTKIIQAGCAEYTGEAGDFGSADDSFQFEFDSEFMIDDIVVNLGSGGSFDYEVRLLYPASTVLPIAVVNGTDFVLNDSNSTRNMWFRVPAWTKLEILVTDSFQIGSLRLGVIGRG